MISTIIIIISFAYSQTLRGTDFNGIEEANARAAFVELNNTLIGCDDTARLWIRCAFHDAVNFNGTGGLDGSILHDDEASLSDNAGLTSLNVIPFFYQLRNAYNVSAADLIALAGKMAVETCTMNSVVIPFKFGRIDATAGSTLHLLPSANFTFNQTDNLFKSLGFNHSEYVSLIYGAHSASNIHNNLVTGLGDRSNNRPLSFAKTNNETSIEILKELQEEFKSNYTNNVTEIEILLTEKTNLTSPVKFRLDSDKNLFDNNATKILVEEYVHNTKKFIYAYAESFKKMLSIGQPHTFPNRSVILL